MKHTYPTLPIDSARIIRLRRQCQKPREEEEIWSWFVLRRISIYVTLLLMRTAVTPNGVSWLGVAFFVLAGGWLAAAEPGAYVAAAACYNAGYLCDCVDGEIARLKQTGSRRGVFLDTLIRACSIPIVTAAGLALWRLHAKAAALDVLAIYAVVVAAAMALLVPLAYQLAESGAADTDPVAAMRTRSRGMEWFAFVTGLPGFFAVLPAGVFVEAVFAVPFNAAFITLFLAAFILKTIVRLVLTYARMHGPGHE